SPYVSGSVSTQGGYSRIAPLGTETVDRQSKIRTRVRLSVYRRMRYGSSDNAMTMNCTAAAKLVAANEEGVVMHKRVVVVSLAVAMSTALAIRLAGQSTAPERQLATRAADARGGRDRVMAIRTLQIVGYGELAYFNGGGNITGDPDAPQKWQKVLESTRAIDLEHSRTRVQQRLKMDFVFASTIGQLGVNRTNETLDGDVAYNVGGGFFSGPPAGGAATEHS